MTTTTPAKTNVPSASKGAAARILFVDDDTKLCEMLALYLQHFGYDVRTAATPTEAISLIGHENFDLIILDLNLAGEDGLEVLHYSKSIRAAMPVLIFTGLDLDEGLVTRCLANHADGFVRKTDGLKTLLGEVHRHLLLKGGLQKLGANGTEYKNA